MSKPKRIRLLNAQNVLDKKFERFEHFTGIFSEVLGSPVRNGIWLVYGPEKNGKTWLSVMLSLSLSKAAKVLYISAEEGVSMAFQETIKRAGIDNRSRNIYFCDYLEIEEIEEILSRKKGKPGVVVFDNITVYTEALKNGVVRMLQLKYPKILWMYIGHEDKNDVYSATGKLVKRLANIIFRVEGLRVFVSGRCPGGEFDIDTERADIYYGHMERTKLKKLS